MTDLLLVVAFAAGVALLTVGAWTFAPTAGMLVLGAILVLLPLLYVRGRWVS